MSRKCCLRTCRELAGQSILNGEEQPRTYIFPRDKQMRARWNLFVNQANHTTDFKATSHAMCSRHFESSCFTSTGSLRPKSIPTFADRYTLEVAQKYRIWNTLKTFDLDVINNFSNSVVQLRDGGCSHTAELLHPYILADAPVQVETQTIDLLRPDIKDIAPFEMDTQSVDPLQLDLDMGQQVTNSDLPSQQAVHGVQQLAETSPTMQQAPETYSIKTEPPETDLCPQQAAEIILPVQIPEPASIKTEFPETALCSEQAAETLSPVQATETDIVTVPFHFLACESQDTVGIPERADESSRIPTQSSIQEYGKETDNTCHPRSPLTDSGRKRRRMEFTPEDFVDPRRGKKFLDRVQDKLTFFRRRLKSAEQRRTRVEKRLITLEATMLRLKQNKAISAELNKVLEIIRTERTNSEPKTLEQHRKDDGLESSSREENACVLED